MATAAADVSAEAPRAAEPFDSDVEIEFDPPPVSEQKALMGAISSDGPLGELQEDGPRELLDLHSLNGCVLSSGSEDKALPESITVAVALGADDLSSVNKLPGDGDAPDPLPCVDLQSVKRRRARFTSLAARVCDKLKAHSKNFSTLDLVAIDGALQEAKSELLGSGLESRLNAAQDDLRRLRESAPEDFGVYSVGTLVQCRMLAKSMETLSQQETVSKRKSKRSSVAVSLQDQIDYMEATTKRIKTEFGGIFGRVDLEFSWFDSYRNFAHMTLMDLEAFPCFLEETLREFESDPDLKASGVDVKERFTRALQKADLHKHLDSILTTEFGEDYDFAQADHLVYQALLKKLWLQMMKRE